MLGTIGYFGGVTGHNTVDSIENSILQAAGHLLTQLTVQNTVKPTIDDILHKGRPDVISIGFITSLWSGSTAMATYVNTITIAYGERHERGATLKSRLLALRLYMLQVLSGVILLPALVLGPDLIDRLLGKHTTPWVHHAMTLIYWPIAAVDDAGHPGDPVPPVRPPPAPMAFGAAGRGLCAAHLVAGQLGAAFVRRVRLRLARLPTGRSLLPSPCCSSCTSRRLAVLLGAELNATLDLTREELDREAHLDARRRRRACRYATGPGTAGLRDASPRAAGPSGSTNPPVSPGRLTSRHGPVSRPRRRVPIGAWLLLQIQSMAASLSRAQP